MQQKKAWKVKNIVKTKMIIRGGKYMFNKSFIQDCLEENADLADLDKYISYWHKNDTGRTLLEFLGLTPYEYQEWLRSEDSILSDILRCRREGINFEETAQQIAKLPDETMGYTELHNYGYQGYAMYPLSAERALELYFHDIPIYHIYPDNTEQLMEDGAYQKLSEDIRTKNKEAIYGVEREVWDKRRETIKEINLINMGRDYLKLYAKYDETAAAILRDLNKESGFSLRFAENVEKDNKESMDAIIYNLTAISRVSTERKKYKEAEESERLLFLLKEYKHNKKLKEDIAFDKSFKKPALDYMEKYEYELIADQDTTHDFTFIRTAGEELPCGFDGWQMIYNYFKDIDELVENHSISELRDRLEGDFSRIPFDFGTDRQIRAAIRYKEKETEKPRIQPNRHEDSRMEERKMAEEKNYFTEEAKINVKEETKSMAENIKKNEEQTGKEFVTVTVAANKIKPFKGKDGKDYCSIDAGQGYSYVRPAEQLRESVKATEIMYFSVPEDYDFTLKRSRSDGQGGFVTEELKVTVNELKERHKKYDDTPDFVKISISAKRVVSSFTSKKSGESIEYCKIMAPEGMTYIRKKEQIHDDKHNEGRKYFMMPKGQEITLEYKTDKITGYTPDNKPIYEIERITVTAEKLKEMYEAEKSRTPEGKNMNDRSEEERDSTNPFVEVQTSTGEKKAIDVKRRTAR